MRYLALLVAMVCFAASVARADDFQTILDLSKKFIAFDQRVDEAQDRALEGAARYTEAAGHLGGNSFSDTLCLTRLSNIHSGLDGSLKVLYYLLLAEKSMRSSADRTSVIEEINLVTGLVKDESGAIKMRLADTADACSSSAISIVHSSSLIELIEEAQMDADAIDSRHHHR